MNIIILAGGGGTRLWPLSRQQKPKQFQKLIGEKTLLEITRIRLGDTFTDDQIYYSITEPCLPFLKTIMPKVADDHILVEPEKRDTGPAMGFVAALLELKDPDEPMAFLPSDHYIANHERFLASLKVGEDMIRETGSLLDIGVVPAWANTDLGYTHVGKRKYERDGIEVMEFCGHTEKPPRKQAEEFLASGEYLWHANYYMWTPRKFLEAYEKHLPEAYALLRAIQDLWKKGKPDAIAEAYAQLPKISVDYAITEKLDPKDVLIIKAPFDWSDVGLWSALKKLREENPEDNVVEGAEHVSMETDDCLIYGQRGKVIATVGLHDVVIVDTPDALLVCDKNKVEHVKALVEKLKEQDSLRKHL